jgi:hypothetical protein
VTTGCLTVRGGRITELDVPLLRVTTTAGQLRRSTITARDRGRVAVTVTSVKPTGKVLVKEGRQTVGSTTLRGADRGAATITLDRLGKGSHDLKAVYAGSSLHAPSTSKKFTLTVKKPKRKRPNARVWPR